MADGEGCSDWGRFFEPGPYRPMNEPSSVNRPRREGEKKCNKCGKHLSFWPYLLSVLESKLSHVMDSNKGKMGDSKINKPDTPSVPIGLSKAQYFTWIIREWRNQLMMSHPVVVSDHIDRWKSHPRSYLLFASSITKHTKVRINSYSKQEMTTSGNGHHSVYKVQLKHYEDLCLKKDNILQFIFK